jgi:hypothetical protein
MWSTPVVPRPGGEDVIGKSMMCGVLVLLASALQDPKPGAAAAAADLSKLSWLSGTWFLEQDGVVTEEHWRPLQGTTLLGTSHTYDKARTRFFEFLRIASSRGKIAYIAMPGGASPTVFPLAKLEDGVVEFENGEHDHPQRIRYERTEKGVTATISQLDGSRAQSFVFAKR